MTTSRLKISQFKKKNALEFILLLSFLAFAQFFLTYSIHQTNRLEHYQQLAYQDFQYLSRLELEQDTCYSINQLEKSIFILSRNNEVVCAGDALNIQALKGEEELSVYLFSKDLDKKYYRFAQELPADSIVFIFYAKNIWATFPTAHLILQFLLILALLTYLYFFRLRQQFSILAPILKIRKLLKNDPLDGKVIDPMTSVKLVLDQTYAEWKKLKRNKKIENDKLYSLIDSMSDAVLGVDLEGQVIFSNQKLRKIFGVENLQKDIKTSIHDPILIDQMNAVFTHGGEHKLEAYALDHHEQGKLIFDIIFRPLKNHKKNIYACLCLFRDVTSLRNFAKMKEDLISNVGHEIRTPLTNIKGFAQVLENMPLDADPMMAKAVRKIINNCDKLNRLFEEILNLGKIERQSKLEKTEISLEEALQSVQSSLQQKYPERFPLVEFHKDFKVDTVFADFFLFEQALFNLMDNAYKYAHPARNLILKVEVTSHKEGALVKVCDNGVGISANSVSRIFERFYRADPSRQKDISGTGLGLAIVKHIVAKHRGQIWVESKLGEGSCFFATFPNT